jgi:hypothetical protein
MTPPHDDTELDRDHPIYKTLCRTVDAIRIGLQDDRIRQAQEHNGIRTGTTATLSTLAAGIAMGFDCDPMTVMKDFGCSDTDITTSIIAMQIVKARHFNETD